MTFSPTSGSGSIRAELQEGFPSARKLTKAQALERACGVGQRKRSFPISMKVKAAEEVSMGKPVKQVARALNVAPKRVREWTQMFQQGCFEAIQKDPEFVQRERKRLSGAGRPLEDVRLEEKLVTFFRACVEDQHPLITTLLRVEALDIDHTWCGGLENPNFISTSASWISRFMARNKLSLRIPTRTGQKLPSNYERVWKAAAQFVLQETEGVAAENCWHGDETAKTAEHVPKKVVAPKGAKTVPCKTAGQHKDRTTAFLVMNGRGRKLPIYYLIFHGEEAVNTRIAQGYRKKNNNTTRQQLNRAQRQGKIRGKFNFYVNKTAWMTEKAMLDWIDTTWKFRGDSSGVLQPKSVLILDDHSAHYTNKVKEALAKLNTKLIIIPGGLTPKAQIMDVLYNRPFKHRVRLATDLHRLRLYKEKKARCAGGHVDYKMSKIERHLTVQHLIDAWEDVD